MIVGSADFAHAFWAFFLFINSSYVRHFCHLHESRMLTVSSEEEVLAETIIRMKGAIPSSPQHLLDLFYQALLERFSSPHSPIDLLPQYLPLLTTLHSLSAISSDVPTAKFIATGAVSPVILKEKATLSTRFCPPPPRSCRTRSTSSRTGRVPRPISPPRCAGHHRFISRSTTCSWSS